MGRDGDSSPIRPDQVGPGPPVIIAMVMGIRRPDSPDLVALFLRGMSWQLRNSLWFPLSTQGSMERDELGFGGEKRVCG